MLIRLKFYWYTFREPETSFAYKKKKRTKAACVHSVCVKLHLYPNIYFNKLAFMCFFFPPYRLWMLDILVYNFNGKENSVKLKPVAFDATAYIRNKYHQSQNVLPHFHFHFHTYSLSFDDVCKSNNYINRNCWNANAVLERLSWNAVTVWNAKSSSSEVFSENAKIGCCERS